MNGAPDAYEIVVKRPAQKDLRDLHPRVSAQVERAIDRILAAFNAGGRPHDMRPLRGVPGGYRVDVGEYRILLVLRDEARLIEIFRVAHRRDVYRNL